MKGNRKPKGKRYMKKLANKAAEKRAEHKKAFQTLQTIREEIRKESACNIRLNAIKYLVDNLE